MSSQPVAKNQALASPVLDLDIVHNTAQWADSIVHKFNRRWEAAMLTLLLQQAATGQVVQAKELHSYLKTLGQTKPLNRAQLLRLLGGIQAFLQLHPSLPLSLNHQPRKASVGPWHIQMTSPVVWQSTGQATANWPYPRLLATPACDAQALLALLNQWLVCDAFAVYGDNLAGLEALPDDSIFTISPDAQALLQLRRLQLLRRSGQYDAARAVAEKLIDEPAPHLDPRHRSYASLMLQRIDYDENPASTWPQLLAHPSPPAKLLAPCPQTMGEWHNLQALALRRSAIAAQNKQEQQHLHSQALLHFESALYMALSTQHWDRLHAYMDNIAFHLQKMLPLGLSAFTQVHDWFALALATADKLDSGHDDAWDLIFFGEFWLDHETELRAMGVAAEHRSALAAGNLHPQHAAYWLHSLQRLRATGKPRQIAICLVLHLRWVGRNAIDQTALARQALLHYLEANKSLTQSLIDEGYGAWLPMQAG